MPSSFTLSSRHKNMIITNFEQLKDFIGIPGIYKFTNIKNNKIYIGEAQDLHERLVIGYRDEIKQEIERPIIYALINYGWKGFEIELINWGDDFKDIQARQALETACIEHFNSLTKDYENIKGNGYNILLFSFSRVGTKHSEKTKKLFSEQRKGEKNANFGKNIWKDKIHPMKGKKCSKERVEKNRLAQLGHIRSEESKQKQSESIIGENHWNFGKKTSLETKQKISNTLKKRAKSIENPNLNKTIYHFKHLITNEEFIGTMCDFYTIFKLNSSHVCSLVKRKLKSHKKWIIIG